MSRDDEWWWQDCFAGSHGTVCSCYVFCYKPQKTGTNGTEAAAGRDSCEAALYTAGLTRRSSCFAVRATEDNEDEFEQIQNGDTGVFIPLNILYIAKFVGLRFPTLFCANCLLSAILNEGDLSVSYCGEIYKHNRCTS